MLASLRLRWMPLAVFPEAGQAMVEYGLLVALIALVALSGVLAVGGNTGALYETIKTAGDAMANVLGS